MRIASDMMGAINGLIELALKDGRRQDAHECAQRAKAAFEALGQPAWLSLMPSLVVMTAEKAANETAETLDAILTSMRDERGGCAGGSVLPLRRSQRFDGAYKQSIHAVAVRGRIR